MNTQTLRELWRGPIADEYRSGRITTERCLQAVIYRYVREKLPEIDVFVEPGLMYYDRGGPRFRPDLLLCEGDEIAFVGEIKFVPHWWPEYLGDLEKLRFLAQEGKREPHPLRIDPKSGKFSGTPHRVVDSTRYALFVIGSSESEGVWRTSMQEFLDGHGLDERFLLFYGRIRGSEDPDFDVE